MNIDLTTIINAIIALLAAAAALIAAPCSRSGRKVIWSLASFHFLDALL